MRQKWNDNRLAYKDRMNRMMAGDCFPFPPNIKPQDDTAQCLHRFCSLFHSTWLSESYLNRVLGLVELPLQFVYLMFGSIAVRMAKQLFLQERLK